MMKLNIVRQAFSTLLCGTLLLANSAGDVAQGQVTSQAALQASTSPSTPPAAPLTTDELDALVAPIALYPDALVAQILGAAASPDQIAIADYWLGQNKTLTGSALAQAVDAQSWDPGVKALTQFPSVLNDLAGNLAWTSNLGQAFENQQSAVMAAVQTMRAKAQAAGNLKSTPQVKVVKQSPQTIVIEPADPNVVYVPQYNPAIVYGSPYVVPLYTPPVAIVTPNVSFGAAIAVGVGVGVGVGIGVGGGFGGFGWGFGSWGCSWGGGGASFVSYQHNTYINNSTYVHNKTTYNNYHPWGPGPHGPGPYGPHPYNPNGFGPNGGVNRGEHPTMGGGPSVPNGGHNGDHGLIGGPGGTQHLLGNESESRPGAPGNSPRTNSFSGDHRQSLMSGDGNAARAEQNRGRYSMRAASHRAPTMRSSGGGRRGGGGGRRR